MTDSEEKGAESKAVRAVGGGGRGGPNTSMDAGPGSATQPPEGQALRTAHPGPLCRVAACSAPEILNWCPQGLSRPGRRPAVGGARPQASRDGQDCAPRPPAAQEGPEAWGARGGGGSAGQPDGRVHGLEEDGAFSSRCVKMNRTRNEARPPWKTLFTNGHQQWAARGC